METSNERSVKFSRNFCLAKEIITTALGGFEKYSDFSKYWITFRYALIDCDDLAHKRENRQFKWGVKLITEIVDTLIKCNYMPENTSEQILDQNELYFSLAEEIIGESEEGHDGDQLSMVEMLNALEIIGKCKIRYFEQEEDLFEIKNALELFLFAHKIVLEAAREEKVKTAA